MKREKNRLTDRAILYLHGGGDRDVWKPEVSFARRYGERAGMDVFYPLYPPFTEASPEEAADFVFRVYRGIVKRYGAGAVSVLGDPTEGFSACSFCPGSTDTTRRENGIPFPCPLL